jgi:hypothetical protein
MRKDRRGFVSTGDVLENRLPVSIESNPLDPPPRTTTSDNPQLSLFQNFLYNTPEEKDKLSNAVDLWDCVPRYSVNRKAANKARENGELPKAYITTFHHRGRRYGCTITPANVKDIDGTRGYFYPGATEELVEDALRKLATDQQAGFFDKPNYRSGVVFSLYALREELAKRGHARSYQQIIMALNVLSGAIIEIELRDGEKGEALVKSPYLPSMVAVSRTRLRDDPDAKWMVQFHPFVTDSINQVTYRQFNYHLMMGHTTQLARWLHKQLVLKYTFADFSKPFEMRYSTIKRDSGLLSSYSRERAAIEALETSFKGLQAQKLLSSYERKDLTGPRKKLLDVAFKIWPSMEFIKEAKAANKRLALK